MNSYGVHSSEATLYDDGSLGLDLAAIALIYEGGKVTWLGLDLIAEREKLLGR